MARPGGGRQGGPGGNRQGGGGGNAGGGTREGGRDGATRGGGRGQGGPPSRDDGLVENVVRINRCAKVMKGGRRFSFSALVVVGDGNGKVGVGFGKANDVPTSVEKGVKEARRSMTAISLVNRTLPHAVKARFGAAEVIMLPAAPGTGVIAGATMRAVLVAAGVKDVLTKSFGTSNPVNLVKATMTGLQQLRTKDDVERLRGVSIG